MSTRPARRTLVIRLGRAPFNWVPGPIDRAALRHSALMADVHALDRFGPPSRRSM